MQLICYFSGSIQVYTAYHPEIEAQRPQFCPVCFYFLPEYKGTYPRQVWTPEMIRILVRAVRCRNPSCRVTISLLPSFCVPFKRYAARLIEDCVDHVYRQGFSVGQWSEKDLVTDRCTASRWLDQFASTAGHLCTEGPSRLGFRQPRGLRGAAEGLWAALRRWAGFDSVFEKVQPALCDHAPYIGMFRLQL